MTKTLQNYLEFMDTKFVAFSINDGITVKNAIHHIQEISEQAGLDEILEIVYDAVTDTIQVNINDHLLSVKKFSSDEVDLVAAVRQEYEEVVLNFSVTLS